MKKVIIIVLLILFSVAGTFFLQTNRKLAKSEGTTLFIQTQTNSTMPVALCGSTDEIYMIGNTFDDQSGDLLVSGIYTLDKEKYKMSLYYDMTLLNSMTFEKIALDKDNNLFSIVRKQGKETIYEIWKIQNGIASTIFDITNLVDDNGIGGIEAFTIDKDGNFFIRQIATDGVIIIDEEGLGAGRFEDRHWDVFKDISNISSISGKNSFESMATGKDGQVYMLFRLNIDGESGFRINSYAYDDGEFYYRGDGYILPSNENISSMGTSSKYDLVMMGNDGVYGYNFFSDTAESIINFPPNEADFSQGLFVEDKLYILFIDVDDEKEHKVNAIELKIVDWNT